MVLSYCKVSIKRLLVILAFIVLLLNKSYAKYDFNANCKKAYEEIINLNFEKARILIAQEEKLNPDNLIVHYLYNTADFISIIISENELVFKTYKVNKDKRISAFEKGDKNSPYYRYCMAEVHLQWAASRIIFNEYVTAAYEINKAYWLLKKNHELYPSFVPNLKCLGLLNALIGSIPDNYKWIVSIIGINGTIEEGVKQISTVLTAAQNNSVYSYLKAESLFFLAYINLNMNNDKEDVIRLLKYVEKNNEFQGMIKTSALVNFSVGYLYLRTKYNNDKAIGVLTDFTPCKGCMDFNFRHYINGLAHLNNLDKKADVYFNLFLKNFKGQNSIKSAYQKLAWSALIHGDTAAYYYNMRNVKVRGKLNTDEDKLAQAEAAKNIIPNVLLLKARLLFDGGFYEKAVSVLKEVNPAKYFINKKDILEYYYRISRIYHEQGDEFNAIINYKKTIELGANETYYYAANASLHLGLIYEKNKNNALAEEFFKKAMNMSNTEYKDSINQRAKSGLLRLKK